MRSKKQEDFINSLIGIIPKRNIIYSEKYGEVKIYPYRAVDLSVGIYSPKFNEIIEEEDLNRIGLFVVSFSSIEAIKDFIKKISMKKITDKDIMGLVSEYTSNERIIKQVNEYYQYLPKFHAEFNKNPEKTVKDKVEELKYYFDVE